MHFSAKLELYFQPTGHIKADTTSSQSGRCVKATPCWLDTDLQEIYHTEESNEI